MKHYNIVNPQIKGTMTTEFAAKDNHDAGLMAFREMSQYFSNNVPSMAFTLKQGKRLVHFHAREKINDKEKVKFTVSEIKQPLDEGTLDLFIKDIDQNMSGGRFSYKDDSSSSSSSSSSSVYQYHKKPLSSSPITHWQYYPKIYPYQYSYMPQFINEITPYVYYKYYDTRFYP